MSKVFKVTPKRIKRSNGLVLTPEMEVIVTTKQSVANPFYNQFTEVIEAYKEKYGFDYKKACCQSSDFTFKVLG